MNNRPPKTEKPIVFPETAERERFTRAGAIVGLIVGIIIVACVIVFWGVIWFGYIKPMFFQG